MELFRPCFLLRTGASSGGVSPTRKEQPLFTLRQVGIICERLLKEREEKVREEYEETMTSKLAGWYAVGVHRRRQAHVSSCSRPVGLNAFVSKCPVPKP